MSDEQTYHAGQHYSGTNRIPNIKQFVESLDRDKKSRDAKIDAGHANGTSNGDAIDHIPTQKPGKNRRTVKDPVTGKEIEIEDIDSQHLKTAEHPMV